MTCRRKLDAMAESIAYSEEFIDKDTVDRLHKDLVLKDDDFFGNTFEISRSGMKINQDSSFRLSKQ
jgi:hypothetical protein